MKKIYALAAFAAITTLASCGSDDVTPEQPTTPTTITLGEAASTENAISVAVTPANTYEQTQVIDVEGSSKPKITIFTRK